MSLDEVWRGYTAANKERRKLLLRRRVLEQTYPDTALAAAQRQEAEALARYLRLLRDLTQTVEGRKLMDGGKGAGLGRSH